MHFGLASVQTSQPNQAAALVIHERLLSPNVTYNYPFFIDLPSSWTLRSENNSLFYSGVLYIWMLIISHHA